MHLPRPQPHSGPGFVTRPAGRHGCQGQPSPFHPGSGGNDRPHRRGGLHGEYRAPPTPAIIAGSIFR
ncbi:hypothetical protein EBESD8_60080 [Rhodococcus aetherivorans]|nr:hypothetical protein EBESD8_60080 [Rhodococcus aetherivorans]